jgi:hypothetical protein
MFHYMRNSAISGTDELLEQFTQSLRSWAPGSQVDTEGPSQLSTSAGLNGAGASNQVLWTFGSKTVLFLVDYKLPPAGSAPSSGTDSTPPGAVPVILSRYLSSTLRHRLREQGWSYWDSTGNASLRCDNPFVMISTDGARRDPEPRRADLPRTLQSLAGAASARVIVLLLTDAQSPSVRMLAKNSGVGLGTASRVMGLLKSEGLVESSADSAIRVPDRTALARRWSADYDFFAANRATRYSSPLGRDGAIAAFARELPDESWGITGLRAASAYFSARGLPNSLPASDLWLYAIDPTAAERAARLRVDPAGDIAVGSGPFLAANPRVVLVGRPPERPVLPWRTVGDLLSAQGRHAAVGEELAAHLDATGRA